MATGAAPSAPVSASPVCATPKPGYFRCFALRRNGSSASARLAAGVLPTGYGPSDLQSAYELPADGGDGRTVAIVDAMDDPNAEADLAAYRAQYGLPPCTTANGCFTKVSQRGGTDYPAPDEGWAGEISLDLDMVSAVAPDAKILLVEADNADPDDLGAADDEAVTLGAKYVSNSYGSQYDEEDSGEDPSDTALDAHYDHPGVAIVVSAGDSGYGVSYPAASPYVTSVGGTSLVKDSSNARGWSETAWGGTGSGCSLYEPSRRSSTTPAARTAPSRTSPPWPTRTPASRCTRPTAAPAGRSTAAPVPVRPSSPRPTRWPATPPRAPTRTPTPTSTLTRSTT